MKKTLMKRLAGFLVLCMIFPMAVYATQEKIDKVHDEIEDLQQQKEEAQQKAESLSQEAGGLEGDLAVFNDKLAKITEELNVTEQQLESTHKSLEETGKALKEAQKEEKSQYEAMKKRIRFLYEMGGNGLLEVLLSAENFADFLNKAEYISSIQEYDRMMLDRYRETKEVIAGKKQELSEQEASLASLKEQQEEKQQEVAELVSDTSEHLNAAKKQLADAQADVAGYAAKLEKQKAYEEQLEAQKAAEDARRLEEIKRQEEEVKRQKEQEAQRQKNANTNNGNSGNNGNTGNKGNGGSSGNNGGSSNASDLSMLAALIQCEAGGESYEGKLAVGSVVMNRVSSSHFPNTVAGVIYQSGQFSPVASGRFASVLASGADASCTQAAGEVLGGRITIGCLYFRSNNGSISGTVIGGNVFY
jgi:spore germination cell wall hydrolase CwlJ-like protein